MGAQQILIKDQQSYYDEALKIMLHSADKYYIHKHFLIGEKINKDKLRHAQLLEEILCTDSCELIDYIHKKIEGQLDHKPNEMKKPKEQCNYNTIINNFNTEAHWQEILW